MRCALSLGAWLQLGSREASTQHKEVVEATGGMFVGGEQRPPAGALLIWDTIMRRARGLGAK
jgi:hypothetical protein